MDNIQEWIQLYRYDYTLRRKNDGRTMVDVVIAKNRELADRTIAQILTEFPLLEVIGCEEKGEDRKARNTAFCTVHASVTSKNGKSALCGTIATYDYPLVLFGDDDRKIDCPICWKIFKELRAVNEYSFDAKVKK